MKSKSFGERCRLISARERRPDTTRQRRACWACHAYVGESSAEARAAAAQGLAEYNAAAREAHSLTPGMADPESYRSHEKHREQMKVLTFDELVNQSRVLVGTPEEVCEKLEYVRERLYLSDVAGNFALGGLTDAQARASMRRFMEKVVPKVR